MLIMKLKYGKGSLKELHGKQVTSYMLKAKALRVGKVKSDLIKIQKGSQIGRRRIPK